MSHPRNDACFVLISCSSLVSRMSTYLSSVPPLPLLMYELLLVMSSTLLAVNVDGLPLRLRALQYHC